jgi:hypothetical protein
MTKKKMMKIMKRVKKEKALRIRQQVCSRAFIICDSLQALAPLHLKLRSCTPHTANEEYYDDEEYYEDDEEEPDPSLCMCSSCVHTPTLLAESTVPYTTCTYTLLIIFLQINL